MSVRNRLSLLAVLLALATPVVAQAPITPARVDPNDPDAVRRARPGGR
jgi:hypothetical protein